MTSFYDSTEYLNFAKVHTRIQQPGGNTYKNMEIYIDRLTKAIETCDKHYNSVGWSDKTARYQWVPSPKITKPIDYDGSQVVERSIFGEKISIHRDGSMTCCKSGFWLDSDSVQQLIVADYKGRYKLMHVLKNFPGSQIIKEAKDEK